MDELLGPLERYLVHLLATKSVAERWAALPKLMRIAETDESGLADWLVYLVETGQVDDIAKRFPHIEV
ncbi:MAG: hypothetical protein ABIN58_08430 [candidate division WOR-3 bacterium]